MAEDCGTSKRPPFIPEQTGTLQILISRNKELVDNLRGRLQPVLRFENPSPGKDSVETPPEPLTPLAEELRLRCNEIEALNNILADILERLEV